MALIKAGVWHTTVWASGTWQEDLWLEYGAYVAPIVPSIGIAREVRATLSLEDYASSILLIRLLRKRRKTNA